MGLSDNITLPDGGLTANFHLDTGHQVASQPSNVSEHEHLYHVEITEQLKSDPTTNSTPETHQGSGMPTPQIPAFATNISYPCTSHYTSPAETSTPTILLPQGPTNRSTGPLTSNSHASHVSSSKPIPSSTYKLRGDADTFTPKSSPTTLYREIRIPPPKVKIALLQVQTVSFKLPTPYLKSRSCNGSRKPSRTHLLATKQTPNSSSGKQRSTLLSTPRRPALSRNCISCTNI